MHKIRKYEYGGLYNPWTGMQIPSIGMPSYPSTLSIIQNSNNFLTTSLNNPTSDKWMKNIGKVSALAKTPTLNLPDINSNLTTPVGDIRNSGDLGKFIGGSFNSILKQTGSNLLIKGLAEGGLKNLTEKFTKEGLKNITEKITEGGVKNFVKGGVKDLVKGINPGTIVGVGTDIASTALGALGVEEMDPSTATTGDKFLDIAAKVSSFIPGVGWITSAGLNVLNLANKHFGKKSKEQRTDDLELKGYLADYNLNAGKKYSLLGNKKRKESNRITKAYDLANLKKSVPGYKWGQEQLAATNTSPWLNYKNQQQLFGEQDYRMLVARKGIKISPARLRNIVNRTKHSVNVIPDGAFHSRRNTLPKEISEQVTKKGIPVVTIEEDGLIKQHAEIERNEIIFRKEATDNIEKLLDEYNKADSQKEKDEIAIKCGKYIAKEILINTDDKTGLIDSVE